ncbi:MAG: hypothetical protein RL417_1195 [Pseudomonadota bacterium]|jgi:hypothetical protein
MKRCKNSPLVRAALAGVVLSLTACSSASNVLNPFYEPPAPVALLGEKNDDALNQGGTNQESARAALNSMATYRRANDPEPVNPVIQPAVVRLMWIPDHLNKSGDLVPAHYYYLKVLKDRWAVTDAFELESQLNGSTSSSNMPFVYGDEAGRELKGN